MANKRGRTPKPLKEHLLENEKLYGDVARRAELEPQTEKVPRKPDELSEMESAVWDYYERTLDEYGLFTLANGPMLSMLVRLHYELDLMNRDIDQKILFGVPIEEMDKIFKMRDKHHSSMLKLYKQMGIGPMEIAKLGCMLVNGEKKGKEDDPDGFFD